MGHSVLLYAVAVIKDPRGSFPQPYTELAALLRVGSDTIIAPKESVSRQYFHPGFDPQKPLDKAGVRC